MFSTPHRLGIALIIIGLGVAVSYGVVLLAGEGSLDFWYWAPEPVLIGAGDTGDCTTDTDEQTARLLEAVDGTVFTLGDNAYPEGSAEQFARCYDPGWGRQKWRTRPTPGNHDYLTEDAAAYYSYFGASAGPAGRGYYSYDLGAWHIIVLNSNIAAGSRSEQAAWLREDLRSHPALCTLAYWHHPVWSSGQYGYNPKMHDIWAILYEYGADVVLNGHEHHYERFAPQDAEGNADPQRGLREFIVGTGGSTLRPIAEVQPDSEARDATTYGVLKLTLRSAGFAWAFMPVEGQSFTDIGEASCVPAQGT